MRVPKERKVTKMTERQITNRIKKIAELEAQMAELQKQVDALKGEIQAEMLDTELLTVGDYVVRWATIITERLDTKAIKKALPEVCKQFMTSSTSRRFTITAAKWGAMYRIIIRYKDTAKLAEIRHATTEAEAKEIVTHMNAAGFVAHYYTM